MYESYYGLQERPFDLSPNPRFLCFTPQHREALAHLEYGLAGRPGVTVLVGEAGTGKTTLVRKALQAADGGSTIIHLSNPTLTRAEFFEYLANGFGFSAEAGRSKIQFLHELEAALNNAAGPRLALIVDEAQSVPYELLEEIRLLTNAESAIGRSIAVVLVGQPELARRLDESRLRQLKQRVVLRCELTPLSLKDTAAYISARIKTAGGEAVRLFSRDAVVAIHQHSDGIPRVISVICDNALVNGFAADQKPVGAASVLEVCRSLSLLSATPAPPTSPAPPRAPETVAVEPQTAMFATVGRRRFSFF
ncbi:MAG TPA: AAA family ATPase [Vicinamibacterales bacterium]|nr:AAA family ATPase [Vicinamibacterales bacterium]